MSVDKENEDCNDTCTTTSLDAEVVVSESTHLEDQENCNSRV